MMKQCLLILLVIGGVVFFASCSTEKPPVAEPIVLVQEEPVVSTPLPLPSPSPIKEIHEDIDIVWISEIEPSIQIDVPLATPDNPFGVAMYREKGLAYLRYGTAKKLQAVQQELQQKGLGLKIWAAYRPFAVQAKMFEAVGKNPNWVSDPYRSTGKKTHVRAVAVDCTLIDAQGNELAMPTPYLDFKKGAEKMKHSYILLSDEILANRKLLRQTMEKNGMEFYAGEWWHYQDKEWSKYPILTMEDVPEIHKALLVDELLK